MISFLEYLPWQAMHFLQHFTHFSKTCCRPLITSKFLALEPPFHGWKSPQGVRSGLYGRCSNGVPLIHFSQVKHRIQFRSCPMQFLGFPNPVNGALRNSEVINSLQHIFKEWVEHCRKCIACQGRYFKKETIFVPPQSSNPEY
jgi:hypothetical protein